MFYYTSDTHFGHFNMTAHPDSKNLCNRPWASVEEMNEALVERWNSRVGPGDTVYHLGDVCMGKLDDSLPVVRRLNGVKILVPGNHDRCFHALKNADKMKARYYHEAGFHMVHDGRPVTQMIGGMLVQMCHFPFAGDSHDEDRYTDHRPKDNGAWLLHGHVHDKWRVRGHQINVGVDVWDYYPVAEPVLIEIMETA